MLSPQDREPVRWEGWNTTGTEADSTLAAMLPLPSLGSSPPMALVGMSRGDDGERRAYPGHLHRDADLGRDVRFDGGVRRRDDPARFGASLPLGPTAHAALDELRGWGVLRDLNRYEHPSRRDGRVVLDVHRVGHLSSGRSGIGRGTAGDDQVAPVGSQPCCWRHHREAYRQHGDDAGHSEARLLEESH